MATSSGRLRAGAQVAIRRADQLAHRLHLHTRWLCDWMDIASGMAPGDWAANQVADRRSSRLLARYFGAAAAGGDGLGPSGPGAAPGEGAEHGGRH